MTVIAVVLLAVAPIVAVLVADLFLGISARSLMRDPAAVTDSPSTTGALSLLGVLLWWTAASVLLFAAYVLRGRTVPGRVRRFLVGAGLINLYLGLDDLFQLHEAGWNEITPLPQAAILAIMLAIVAGFLLVYREIVLRADLRLLIAAAAMFMASLLLDTASDYSGLFGLGDLPTALSVIEESFKWWGIVAWTAAMVSLASDAVRSDRSDEAAHPI